MLSLVEQHSVMDSPDAAPVTNATPCSNEAIFFSFLW